MHVGEWVCEGSQHWGGRMDDGMTCQALCVLNPGSCVSGLSPEALGSPWWVGLPSGLCRDVLGGGRGATQALTWLGRLAHPEWHL